MVKPNLAFLSDQAALQEVITCRLVSTPLIFGLDENFTAFFIEGLQIEGGLRPEVSERREQIT